MKLFREKPSTNLTPEEKSNLAWDEMSKKYWWYEEGKRARFPSSFDEFYEKQKAKWKNALDIGGGTGKFAIPMSQDGLHVTLLEPSSGMRKGAEINLKKAKQILKGKVEVVEGESKKLNFPDGSFNFVFAKGSIHHNMWQGIQQSFKEATRVLRPGGFFIFQGRSTNDSALSNAERVLDTGITAKDKEGWKKGVIQHYFTQRELVQLAIQNGLEIVIGPEEIIKEGGNARFWVVYRKKVNPT